MHNTFRENFIQSLIKIFRYPILFLLFFYSIYHASIFLAAKYNINISSYLAFLHPLKETLFFIIFYWAMYNAVETGSIFLLKWANTKNYTFLQIIFPPVYSSIRGILFVVMMNMLIFSLNLPGIMGIFLEKSAKIILILIIANVLYKIICSLERYIANKYIENNANPIDSRKINTQLTLLKRVIIFIGGLLTFIVIAMLFDSTKILGASLLTTAGILSAVGAFASQQSLGRLFAGLQLAFTQPMRIGDTVVIDNEFGQVEEITLSFITIKLWDLRRLILPTDYFTNKGLLNLTRQSSELLGTIFLYTDYTLPIEKIREKFFELLNHSIHWNKNTGALEVTDMKESTMEIRCLVSADDASHLWKLRCELREKLITYIAEEYDFCLAKVRNVHLNSPPLVPPDNVK